MVNINKSNSSYYMWIWNILFSEINFRNLMNNDLHAQMAEQSDATSKACSTTVGTSANLVLGTIDDYILQEEIVPLSAKKTINEKN